MILALTVLQLLYLLMMTCIFGFSLFVLCIRIIFLLVRLSREHENGFMGLVQPTGAPPDMIEECTSVRVFVPGSMEEDNAL